MTTSKNGESSESLSLDKSKSSRSSAAPTTNCSAFNFPGADRPLTLPFPSTLELIRDPLLPCSAASMSCCVAPPRSRLSVTALPRRTWSNDELILYVRSERFHLSVSDPGPDSSLSCRSRVSLDDCHFFVALNCALFSSKLNFPSRTSFID